MKKGSFAMMKKKLSAVALLSILTFGCSTDFDVVAPYDETIVINGLLDVRQPVQYVRVTKAFLGEGNVLTMAQQPDSVNYADILDVTMERMLGNSVVNSYPMQRTDTIPKDSGLFAYPYQVLYTFDQPILQDGSLYRIRVTNRETGETATSITRIVRDMTINTPVQGPVDLATNPGSFFAVSCEPKDNTKAVDLVIRFNYTETDSSSGITTEHFVDWNFAENLYATSVPGEETFFATRSDFWEIVGLNIPAKSGVVRRVDNLTPPKKALEFIFIASSEDLITYKQLLNPSQGIVQDKPLFTTVENGLGLFTSRVVHSEFRDMNTVMKAAFDTSVYTSELGFYLP